MPDVMKNKFGVFITLLWIILSSCENRDSDAFRIRLRIKNNPGPQTVTLVAKQYGNPPVIIDTSVLGKGNGSITLTGDSDQEGIFSIRFGINRQFLLLTNDRTDIDIDLDWNNFAAYTTNSASSNSLHTLLSEFNDQLVIVDSLRKQIVMEVRSDSMVSLADSVYRQSLRKVTDYVLNYADTTRSAGVAMYAIGILQQSQVEKQRLEPLIARLAKKFASNEEMKRICDDYFVYIRKLEGNGLLGKPAPEIRLPDTSGKLASLSAMRGRYVLVDFWASWCVPCRQENPNLVSAYSQFKNRNFTILGVSLDRNRASWIKAIQDDHLEWTQISDLGFWQSKVVDAYHLEAIPFNVLIDPGGKIIATNLRGASLKEQLATLIK